MKITKWAGLASESGTILDYMCDFGLSPAFVVVDQDCPAADKARARGLEVKLLPRAGKFHRDTRTCDPARIAYTLKVRELLQENNIDLVVMAGWMSVFSANMFETGRYGGRVLNAHPALLPAFKGAHAVRDALAFGVKVTGCTIHLATENLDDGPILGQEPVKVRDGDTKDSLHERIKEKERPLYTSIVTGILDGHIDPDKLWTQWLTKQS